MGPSEIGHRPGAEFFAYWWGEMRTEDGGLFRLLQTKPLKPSICLTTGPMILGKDYSAGQEQKLRAEIKYA